MGRGACSFLVPTCALTAVYIGAIGHVGFGFGVVADKSSMNSRKDDERTKFVSFAFAAAETFLEIDTEVNVLFPSGVPFSAGLFGAA